MTINVGGAEQAEIERLEARVEELEAALAYLSANAANPNDRVIASKALKVEGE